MSDARMKDALKNIARRGVPENINLWPNISARLERKSPMVIYRTRLLMIILITLLILLLLSGVAYALGRSLGYIPGIGLVDRSASIRVLADPVSMTRNGVTITVEEATLSADKTVIRFSVNNLPSDMDNSQDITKCDTHWGGLKLPDGSVLQTVGGYGLDSWHRGFEARFTFEPVPTGVNQAALIPPCIHHYFPGEHPENWELPLHFISAPVDLKPVPVIELTPSQDASGQNPMVLEKVIETEKGYILIGKFYSMGLPQDAKAVNFSVWPKITDANGQEVSFTLPNYELGLPLEKQEEGVFSWAVELDCKSFNWPLTISSEVLGVEYEDARSQFEFNTGPNPQEGQTWQNLNIDFDRAGHPVRLLSVLRTAEGYQFSFESRSSTVFQAVGLSIGNSTQGLSGRDGPSLFGSEVKFADEVPSGKLTILATHPVIDLPGRWQLQWKPDNITLATPPVSMQSPQACLITDSWRAALSNPAPIPVELNNRVLVSGRVIEDGKPASEENTGIYISRLDGSEKQVILQGHNWASPSLSKDGSQVVYDGTGYAGANGLYILDLATGQTHYIPNTSSNDMAPLWSPDGSHIAFIRFNEQDLYLIQPNGSSLQRITNGAGYEQLVGWWPDSSAFVYATDVQGGWMFRKFDVNSGNVSDLFVVSRPDLGVAISPDGSQIAFIDKETKSSIGLYISRIDGSDCRRVAFVDDYLGILNLHWSPDGKWLLVNILDTPNMDNADAALALVTLKPARSFQFELEGQSVLGFPRV